ncbi:hypothetical protein GOBAR_AA25928 [Gossypium barbadense]|uniref:Uncharacterized protein n=1 Tax=Gossypium barbadense TaxID=3634 RepID=A0A2P5WUJ7_GOSBA|nr:hypothetical protein GOBAR_AA25928 [Gossypium barbadense]
MSMFKAFINTQSKSSARHVDLFPVVPGSMEGIALLVAALTTVFTHEKADTGSHHVAYLPAQPPVTSPPPTLNTPPVPLAPPCFNTTAYTVHSHA